MGNGWVSLKNGWVGLKNGWVGLKNGWVGLKNGWVGSKKQMGDMISDYKKWTENGTFGWGKIFFFF